MAPRLDRTKYVAKSQAQQLYCLTARELDGLPAEERPNPRNRKGPSMKLLAKASCGGGRASLLATCRLLADCAGCQLGLGPVPAGAVHLCTSTCTSQPRCTANEPARCCLQEDLERAALAKFGSLAALEAERERRRERREQRSIVSYFQQQQTPQEQASGGQQQQAAVGQQPGAEQHAAEQHAAEQQPQQDGQPGQQQQDLHAGGQPAGSSQQQQAQHQHQPPQQQRAPPLNPGSGPLTWLSSLPPLIAERVCMVPRQQGTAAAPAPAALAVAAAPAAGSATQQSQPSGEQAYVLYWMKTAVRGHENPALDAAAAAARQMGLPLLVASFLLASHPYASARRYKFVLEGLRDAQAELRRQVGCAGAG